MTRMLFVIIVLLPAMLMAVMPYEKDPFWLSTEINVNSTGLSWHDVNLDGYLDLFISNGNDITQSKNYIYLNNAGTLSTTHDWQSSINDYSGHNAVGDINGDGYPELFISNYIGPSWVTTVSYMYSNNNGTMIATPAWTTPDLFHSFASALGDPDGDGDLDIAFACGEGYNNIQEQLIVYFNIDGAISDTGAWYSANSTEMIDVAWGDVDRDGDLDLAFCGDEGRVWLYYNINGVLEAVPSWVSTDVNSSNTLAWGDMNGDGYLDLAVADNSQIDGNGKFKVYRNTNGVLGTNPHWQSSTGGYGSAVCWYDFDRDGLKDLAAGRWWGEVMIYKNTGTTLTTTPVWSSNTNTVIEEIKVCDLDRDGVEEYHDSKAGDSVHKVFYVNNYPMHWLDSVIVDGVALNQTAYCFDLNDGWVSLAAAPASIVDFYYQYSDKQDLSISNWDVVNMIFADTLTHVSSQGWVQGDADGSGEIDISDAVYIIAYIFSGGPPSNPLLSADCDCSNAIDISDAVYLINYVFSGGLPPCEMLSAESLK